MNKRKSIIISVSIVIFIIVLVFSATYAYLVSITNEGNINEESGMLGINYNPPLDSALTGTLNASSDRNGGLIAVASASLKTNSEKALFNMYITPTILSDSLKIEAFKWEVVVDGVVIRDGDFADGASVNTPIKIVDSYELTTDTTVFNIYIWLDVSTLQTGVGAASFKADITADSVPITGSF